MSSRMYFCFEKTLSMSDVTKTILEVPRYATNLPEENKEVVVVKDQTGRKWVFEVAIKNDEKQKRLQGQWSGFTKAHGLMKGVIVKFYFNPIQNLYSVEFEGQLLSGWRITSRTGSFEKKLSEEDFTGTLDIPLTASYSLDVNNQPIMVVWDQTGKYWEFQTTIGGGDGNKRLLEREKWLEFANHNQLEVGETLKLRYFPTRNSYSAEYEGHNRIPTLQLYH
ncbi:unnamed protein product [Camellia sinensis]